MVIGGRGAARVQPFVERHQPYIKPSIPADAYSTVMTRTNASVDATIEVLLMGLDPRAQSKRLIDELTALHQRKVLKVVDMVIVRREADRSISASARTELSDTEAKHLRRVMKSAVGFQLGPEQQVSTVRFEGTSVLLGVLDISSIADMLGPREGALVVIVEHRWASRLGRLIRSKGMRLMEDYMLTPEVLNGARGGISTW